MKNNDSVLKAASIFLNISLGIFLLWIFGAVLTVILNPELNRLPKELAIVISLAGGSLILYILISLKLIVKTIRQNNPFCTENIKRFKTIGYSIFIIGVLNAVLNFPGNNDGANLIATPYGSIKFGIFIYIVLGFLALVLAEVFAEAARIKNENDMTI